jgi:hypothetical protein
VEVGGEAKQIDLAAVSPGVTAGGVEFAPEGPGAPQRIAGQGGIEATDGDGSILQRRDDPAGDEQCPFSLRISNGPRLPPHVAY